MSLASGSPEPLLELWRGTTVESIHFGSAAVVDASGRMLAWIGDPQTITFLRSSAKPFQALPFIENGGHSTFNLTLSEIALICGSHTGTDMHVKAVCGIQDKTCIRESDLQCGTHPPFDKATADHLFLSGEKPSTNRHNCSGKHSGMLAYAKMHGHPLETYLDPEHPVQREILATLAEMCALDAAEVRTGIDGCSAPIFAVPLFNAAVAFARLCDPYNLSEARAAACHTIVTAMTSHPEMVSGTGRFDTRLMEAGGGKILTKGGAEGYQATGLLPGALGPGSPGIGIVLKVSDGDQAVTESDGERRSRVRPSVTLEILCQLGALNKMQLSEMAEFGPVKPVLNWRKLVVGESRPVFTLHRA
jgi:L-asparaginase II